MRTAKGGEHRKGPDFPAFSEGVMAALLLIGAALVVMTNYTQIRELDLFAGGAGDPEPAVPGRYRARLFEGSRALPMSAYWRSVEAKVAENLPRPAPVAEAPAQLPVSPADNRVEVQ